MNRRKFIRDTSLLIGGAALVPGCAGPASPVKMKGGIVGANSAAGHLFRDAQWINSDNRRQVDTLIIGGGISGLSAARWLLMNGYTDFLLLELDKETGGNSTSGKNAVSAYPWGAHYVPIPNNDCKAYMTFLEEAGVITGYDEKGLPVVNEYYLCFEPQERLYISGHWQDGLVPDFGVDDKGRKEIKDFFRQVNVFRLAKGEDGKDAFNIPVDWSSSDKQYRELDLLTMKEWLQQNNYQSPHLHWYVNYCCRDDFGTDYSKTSAWAGIHYFAGRKGVASNAPAQSVITWPEGNAWLARELRKTTEKNIQVNTAALKLRSTASGVEVCTMNTNTKQVEIIEARQCIVAIPQFAAASLLDYPAEKKQFIRDNFIHYPWMVANLTIEQLSERGGAGLSWDNVIYNAGGLGYVEATHQQVERGAKQSVVTYYYPLTQSDATEERQMAFRRSYDDWISLIRTDLDNAHANFDKAVKQADVWVWGHGMISPQPGFIHGEIKRKMQEPVDNKIFFAHTDLSGISIFEEAFYQGIGAAQQVLKKQTINQHA